MKKQYCLYYQADVTVEKTWFIVGSLRNEDHVAFERTLEGQSNILEFFVPIDQEKKFLDLINYFTSLGYVKSLEKMPNRYQIP